MRDTRIKAWDTINHRMTMPVFWMQIADDKTFERKLVPAIFNKKDNKLEPLEGYILLQYTGEKDYKGVEIFEGDLLKHIPDGYEPHNILEVYWDEVMDGFQSHTTDTGHLYQTPLGGDYYVIGNIYENKNLLEREGEKLDRELLDTNDVTEEDGKIIV
jgi:uncharacterized phage protein (TIGR01671 family)